MTFKGYTFFEHTYPIESGYKGYILNQKGNIVAFVKLDGRIISFEEEEERRNRNEKHLTKNRQ